MTKQEFLAMSLPHKLKVYVKYNHKPDNSELETMIGIVDDCIITDMHEEDMAPLSISNYGLCLHPLSDLTKEIEHKGEKFNPSYKLGVDRGFEFYKPSNFDLEINFETPKYSTQIDLFTGFLIVQKLIEWHFDIADLISKGEAIDVNTLDINPYK